MALQGYTGPTNYVSRLDNRPNADGGLTADQLKAVFDQFGTEFVEWFNGTFLAAAEERLAAAEERLAAIEELPATPLNKNLLHNWDFRNPVNQRGQSSYTGSTDYCVDRWVRYANATVTVNSGYITLAASTIIDSYLFQRMEGLPNGVYTLSINIDGDIKSTTLTWDGSTRAETTLVFGSKSINIGLTFDTGSPTFFVLPKSVASYNIYAVKLEPGSISTLAYDPPADYGEELRKCQRYLFNAIDTPASGVGAALGTGVAVSTTEIRILLPIPAHMRPIAATVILSSPSHFQCVGEANLNISALTYSATSTNTVMLIATVPGTAIGRSYYLRRATGATDGHLLISKEL